MALLATMPSDSGGECERWISPTKTGRRSLEAFVDDKGFVDYDGLRDDRRLSIDSWRRCETKGPQSTPELFPDREDQLAYYINAYNALVFEGVLGLGPGRRHGLGDSRRPAMASSSG